MAKVDFILSLLKKQVNNLSRLEKDYFEALLFSHVVEQAMGSLGPGECLINTTVINKEEPMLNIKTMQAMLNDIINSGEYTLAGIAHYTQIPEDVLVDTLTGKLDDLSFESAKKIMNLHIAVRRNLYENIMFKIAQDFFVRECAYNS